MSAPQTVLFVFGTRPEAIKLGPLIQDMMACADFHPIVCVTAQHREMLDQVMNLFEMHADYDLDLMRPNQTLAALTSLLLNRLDTLIENVQPKWVVVQGDTTSAFAASLAAFYRRMPVAHVEAGLRTYDLGHPFPEEFNRRAIDSVAQLHFAPTRIAAENLQREGVRSETIVICGNTGIDALLRVANKPFAWNDSPLASLKEAGDFVFVTAHRRESFGAPLENICRAIRELAEIHPTTLFIYPVHLNPNVRKPVQQVLQHLSNVKLLEPIDYSSTVQLLRKARLILTDSGGLQEEAPSFGIPILVMRERTERPEAVSAGFAQVVGTDRGKIVSAANRLLALPPETRIKGANPFGDGRASERILERLKQQRQK